LQAVGIILLLISIGTVVGPIGAVVIMYRDNLIEIVIPTQIVDLMNGNSSILQGNSPVINSTGNSTLDSYLPPFSADFQIDNVSRTFIVTVNFTNLFNFDLTVNEVSAEVICTQHSYPLGNVGLDGVVAATAGETAHMRLSGSWTDEARNHIHNEHPDATSIEASLINLSINVNGIVIQESGPVSIGSIPLN
jgi:hypothetical protein